MEALLGFHVDFWDYVTFGAMAVIVMAFLALAVFILGLPGRIAIARKHPEADAIYLMGWIGFLAVVPWIQALIWAFKPTDVIDIRHMPGETQHDTDAMIARAAISRMVNKPIHAAVMPRTGRPRLVAANPWTNR
jgi:hypothetical protein